MVVDQKIDEWIKKIMKDGLKSEDLDKLIPEIYTTAIEEKKNGS